MKATIRKTILLLALSGASQAADLTSNGDWVETVTAENLVSGAGSNLQAQLESIAGVTTLTISNAPGAWSVRARRSAGGGHDAVTVYVKRVSAGSGSGSIVGGTAYLELGTSDLEIFSGSEARSGISLQFKLTGLSRNVPPATYLSTIIFTVQ